MDKQQILAEIRRTAGENGGVPLGVDRFTAETGIKEYDWRGRYWARWNDAVREAGFTPNTLNPRFQDEELLEPIVTYMRELGRYPTVAEMRLRKRQRPEFPSDVVISRRWTRQELAPLLLAFCERSPEWSDVAEICRKMAVEPFDATQGPAHEDDNFQTGYVYLALMKVGREKRYKIGKANLVEQRTRQVAVNLPEELELIHAISTDDAYGIEAYWHRRFADKRRGGEWFQLTRDDVRAFKRRKFQ